MRLMVSSRRLSGIGGARRLLIFLVGGDDIHDFRHDARQRVAARGQDLAFALRPKPPAPLETVGWRPDFGDLGVVEIAQVASDQKKKKKKKKKKNSRRAFR